MTESENDLKEFVNSLFYEKNFNKNSNLDGHMS